MKQYKSQSTINPVPLDDKSSIDTVYRNTNVKQITYKDIVSNTDVTMYEYDVTEYTKDEWIAIKLRGDIDFIALEIGVDL